MEWKCDNANAESKRAAQRLGFQPEGVFRQHMIVKGKNRDTAWFAMIDEDWPKIRANFEAYLSTPGLSLTELTKKRYAVGEDNATGNPPLAAIVEEGGADELNESQRDE